MIDLGCGSGDYAIEAAARVGDSGRVFAVDHSEGLILGIDRKSREARIENIEAIHADITQRLPFSDGSMDVCFLATVMHTIHPDETKMKLIQEIKRILKPDGQAAILNVKKEELPFGPPTTLKSSPMETEVLFKNCGFKRIGYDEFEYSYLIRFRPED